MPTVSTDFTLPCTKDLAVLAVQDALNQLQWNIMTMSSTEVVASQTPIQQAGFRVKLTVHIADLGDSTRLSVTSSAMFGAFWDGKKRCTEMMGTFVNAVSLRVQTQSIAINPTVAIGEGQGGASAVSTDRVGQLKQLKELLDEGVLTVAEFEQEKARILGQP